MLVILDDLSNLYLINVDGKEVTRQSNKQLKVPLPIIAIVALEDASCSRSL